MRSTEPSRDGRGRGKPLERVATVERVARVERRSDAPTAALVREAIAETRELVKLEIVLAKDEILAEVEQARRGAMALGAAAALAVGGLALLVIALVQALAAGALLSLLLGASLLLLAGVAAYRGWRRVPRHPLDRTRRRLSADLTSFKEHVA